MASKLGLKLNAIAELGLTNVVQNANYKIGLRLGIYRGYQPANMDSTTVGFTFQDPLPNSVDLNKIRKALGQTGVSAMISRAERVLKGEYHQFGHSWAPIDLRPEFSTVHWVDLELGKFRTDHVQDIKLVWEPARFCWAAVLGMANMLQPDPKYGEAFYSRLMEFQEFNLVSMGPNWQSAQEVAIRLINILLASHYFSRSGPTAWDASLPSIVIDHAQRIMQTLDYARSQNNNHYLSECVALVSAAKALPNHPLAPKWMRVGWAGIRKCLKDQFETDGEYVQHSTNYHRLMLHLFIWLSLVDGDKFTVNEGKTLANAAKWYADRVDLTNGLAPNLGANDGAIILDLSQQPYSDHRPTAQASVNLFCDETLKSGEWDDLPLWLGLDRKSKKVYVQKQEPWRIENSQWRATVRVIRYRNRPSHADHLHTEIWHSGKTIAIDAGTYSYNSPEPWQNPLTHAGVHNTITVNGHDQMVKLSKFLYTKWGRSWIENSSQSKVSTIAEINGEERYTHHRVMNASVNGIMIEDNVTISSENKNSLVRLQWLLDGIGWHMSSSDKNLVWITNTISDISIKIHCSESLSGVRLTQAGENITGNLKALPSDGWQSSSYMLKIPATSIAVEALFTNNCSFTTEFFNQEMKKD